MKKIYLSILAVVFSFTINAQLTLTKAFNEPIIGDVDSRQGYDSSGVIPKSSGAGQNWNFSTITTNTVSEVFTYTTVASTPSASAFPTSNLAEDDGVGGYNYFNAAAGTYETTGFTTAAGSSTSLSNSGIVVTWPVSFGFSGTDTYAGTADYLSLTGPAQGTITTTAPGSGTVTLPGSIVFNNCLQVKIINSGYATIGTFPFSFTIETTSTDYQYYAGSQKFPILLVSYSSQTVTGSTGPTVSDAAGITVNNNVLTGINNINLEVLNYNVYPNPATESVNIRLTNDKTETVSIIVTNNLGQVVRSANLGNAAEVNYAMSTFNLTSGIYYVKTSIGERSTTKKLIIK